MIIINITDVIGHFHYQYFWPLGHLPFHWLFHHRFIISSFLLIFQIDIYIQSVSISSSRFHFNIIVWPRSLFTFDGWLRWLIAGRSLCRRGLSVAFLPFYYATLYLSIIVWYRWQTMVTSEVTGRPPPVLQPRRRGLRFHATAGRLLLHARRSLSFYHVGFGWAAIIVWIRFLFGRHFNSQSWLCCRLMPTLMHAINYWLISADAGWWLESMIFHFRCHYQFCLLHAIFCQVHEYCHFQYQLDYWVNIATALLNFSFLHHYRFPFIDIYDWIRLHHFPLVYGCHAINIYAISLPISSSDFHFSLSLFTPFSNNLLSFLVNSQ